MRHASTIIRGKGLQHLHARKKKSEGMRSDAVQEAAHWSALDEHAFELRLPARRARRPRIADRLQVNGFEPLTLGGARAFAQTYKTALSTSLNLFRPYESPRTTRPDEAVRASSFLLVVERGRGATAAAVESLRSGPARLQSVRGSREHRRAVDR